jgi:hypothetical protein
MKLTLQAVVEQVIWVGACYIFSLNKIIPRLEKPEIYGLCRAGGGICSLHLHIAAMRIKLQPYIVTEAFHRDL